MGGRTGGCRVLVEDLGVDRTIILKCIFMMWHGLFYLADMGRWRVLVNAVMNLLRVP
jgi:hypothetical protein